VSGQLRGQLFNVQQTWAKLVDGPQTQLCKLRLQHDAITQRNEIDIRQTVCEHCPVCTNTHADSLTTTPQIIVCTNTHTHTHADSQQLLHTSWCVPTHTRRLTTTTRQIMVQVLLQSADTASNTVYSGQTPVMTAAAWLSGNGLVSITSTS